MSWKKATLLLFSFLFIAAAVITHFALGFPVVIPLSVMNEDVNAHIGDYQPGDSFQVLEQLNFDEGEWSAYLVYNYEDQGRVKCALPHKVYKTSNTSLLKEMQENWVFTCTGADIATIQSYLLILSDGEPVYSSNIVLDKNWEAFQSPQCGAVMANSGLLLQYFEQFEPVHWPILIL